ncbi:MAG: J domain-containing protein [Methylomonas sp.]|nr:J domain-containing protein [Methylomonas sp.]PPD22942.1 MAG: molecular chaperone DnaJ [Methylomonas sp.]PPD23681.1 MAG: molecular chaperone DnaJ [Methylomonas sp.]PPD31586.1 MAG: molecular chaperone DnaJ [Methylomonas sp.]PPD41938.1 MAG: molecular chaperone DnaJ [Methylomonas sp.]
MNLPYQILGVTEQATDTDIKNAYLQAVKDHPPDRDSQRFRQIQQAFEAIKDEDSRLRHALFDFPDITFDALLDSAFARDGSLQPMPADDFLKLLNTLSIEQTLATLNKTPS